jgi:hypothetical protein
MTEPKKSEVLQGTPEIIRIHSHQNRSIYPRLLRGGRQDLVVDQGLQSATGQVLGVNRPCEPSLAA